jgi:hypothetical protein
VEGFVDGKMHYSIVMPLQQLKGNMSGATATFNQGMHGNLLIDCWAYAGYKT